MHYQSLLEQVQAIIKFSSLLEDTTKLSMSNTGQFSKRNTRFEVCCTSHFAVPKHRGFYMCCPPSLSNVTEVKVESVHCRHVLNHNLFVTNNLFGTQERDVS